VRWRGLSAWTLPVLLYALWWVASHHQWMSPQILPTPELVWQTATDLLGDNLVANLLISLRRLAFGLVAGVLGGTLLGAAMGTSRTVDAVIAPSFYALAQIPTLAWLPLLMVVLGIGESLKVVLIIKAVLVPVAIHTQLGVRTVPPRLREMAAVLRLPRGQAVRLLIAPAALPPFLTGLRLGLAQGWLTLIAVELLASSEGIGYLMVWGRQMFQLDIVFVCIAVIGVVGFTMDYGIPLAARRVGGARHARKAWLARVQLWRIAAAGRGSRMGHRLA
jgi:sulfonate transport system permease protein